MKYQPRFPRQSRMGGNGLRTLCVLPWLLAAIPGIAAPPVASPGALTLSGSEWVEDRPDTSFDLSTVFSDPDVGDTLTYSRLSSSGDTLFGDSVNTTTGWLDLITVPDASGTQTLTFQAMDTTGETASFELTIVVTGVNDVPEAADDSVTMNEVDVGGTGSAIIDVLANDVLGDPETVIVDYGRNWPSDVDPQYTNVSESEPTTQVDLTGNPFTLPNGTIALLPDGRLEYSPKENYSGTDYFTYTIRDADGQESSATVTVNVVGDNDVPRTYAAYEYTVKQGEVLTASAGGGLLSHTIDDDGDALQVFVVTPPAIGSLTLDNDSGAFTYTPPAAYGGVGDPPVTFVVQYRELPSGNESPSAQTTVTIYFDPDDPAIDVVDGNQITQLFNLADVPLEDAISAESNVLVMMDDSGSMDWGTMVPGPSNVFYISNVGVKQSGVSSRSNTFAYLHRFSTDLSTSWNYVPTEEALDGNSKFNGNNYGVWRAWNSQYNKIYYNPKTFYQPWVGLDRTGQDFPNANPAAARLNPFDTLNQTVSLVAENLSYTSNNVPSIRNDSNGYESITNTNVHLAHYYTTTAPEGVEPAWDEVGQRIDIRANYTLNDGTVLTSYPGGPDRIDCAADDGDPMTCTYAQEIQNFANWFSYYRIREYTAKAALGRAISGASNLRMGYGVLNQTSYRENFDSLNASYRIGHKRDLLDRVYGLNSSGGTPLRAALDRAGRTFECVSGNVFGTSASSPGSANCPVATAPEGECQSNFTLLFSDGEWNGSFTSGLHHDRDTPTDQSPSLFDGGKFADNWASTLGDVAMYYYERDLHPTLTNRVPTSTRDQQNAPLSAFGGGGETMHQHMKTFTVGFGLYGDVLETDLPTNYAQAFAWPDPTSSTEAKVDDMMHAAVNGRGQFVSAADPVLLTKVFQNAFAEFSDSSISVSAVAFNSTALREDTVEYRGFFNPRFHTGDLMAMRVDRTTGVVDAANPLWRAAVTLDGTPASSRVIGTWDDVVGAGKRFEYAYLNADQKLFMNANEVDWLRGGRANEEPNGIYRQRPATEGLLGDIVHSAPVFVGAPRGFRRDQAPYPTASGELYSTYANAQMNRRRVVYVGANDGMLHGFDAGTVSATGTGAEVMAYVPNKLIDGTEMDANHMDQLASLTYSHRYFVDVTPAVEDVYMKPGAGSLQKDWMTLLVGGLGGGGKGYFALNVTDPSGYSAAGIGSKVLWEFTDEDDTYPVDANGDPLVDDQGAPILFEGRPIRDLGFALAQPQIVMTNLNDNDGQKQWAAVFGNGYNATSGFAKVFLLLVDKGMDGWSADDFVKLDTGAGSQTSGPMAGMPNGIGTVAVVDYDNNGTADYIYGGDLFGNLYRFDITSSNKSEWTVTRLFQATLDGTAATQQPVTTQPLVLRHPEEGLLVVFGTGSWLTHADGTDTHLQSIYGIWDRFEVSPATATATSKSTRLVEQVISNIVDETNTDFPRQRLVTANAVEYVPDTGGVPGVYGWYIDLDPVRPVVTQQGNVNSDTSGNAPPAVQYPGERAIRRFILRGDAILVTTVVPRDANSCTQAPPGATFPIDPLSGGNPKRPIFDLNNDGVIDDQDFMTVGGIQYASGIVFSQDDLNGTLVDPSMLVGTGDYDFLFISGGDEQVTLRIAPPEDQKTGRLSWREMFPQ
ncbi:MAG: cadherin-like domain-containing protein [Pseudomonadales bacterium]|nr:cadherin-like domain-containing protein [Pseudomonadales bacterium]